MRFTEEMIAEDEKRWHARDVVEELGYCSEYMRDRRDISNLDIRFYAYIMRRAYEMLKKQEPRLVTEADFENADEYGFIPVWCEERDKNCYLDHCECIPRTALETAKEDRCRYWTSKPSLKQMEETPWE